MVAIGLVLIAAGVLVIIYAMQGSPVFNLKKPLGEPGDEGAPLGEPGFK